MVLPNLLSLLRCQTSCFADVEPTALVLLSLLALNLFLWCCSLSYGAVEPPAMFLNPTVARFSLRTAVALFIAFHGLPLYYSTLDTSIPSLLRTFSTFVRTHPSSCWPFVPFLFVYCPGFDDFAGRYDSTRRAGARGRALHARG